MAKVTQLPKATSKTLPAGMVSLLIFINQRKDAIREKKYPQIVEVSKDAKPFKIDNSWNFDVPVNTYNIKY